MLPVKIGKQTYADVETGQGTATGTASAITAEPWMARYGVYIRNHDGSNPMYVGPSGITTGTGFRLDAGESVWLPVEEAGAVYVVSGGSIVYSFMVI